MKERTIELVEESFRNGGGIVICDETTNTIWVCDDVKANKKKNELIFKGCYKADISDDDEEYYGECMNDCYTLRFRVKDDVVSNNLIITRFYNGELVSMIRSE